MAKTDLERFNQGIGALLTLGAKNPAIYKAYFGVLEWMQAQQDVPRAKETIGAKLALGGYALHTENAKAHRNAVRGYMLLMATRYANTDDQLATIAEGHKSYSNAQSTQTVVNKIVEKSAGIIVAQGGIVVMPEVYDVGQEKGLAGEALTRNIRKSRDEAKRIIQAGLSNISLKDPDEHMKRWFGALSNQQKAQLKQNLTNMLDGLNSKSIQFKVAVKKKTYGTASPQSFESLMQQQYIRINLGHYFFTSSGDHSNQTVHDQAFYDRVLGTHMALKDERAEVQSQFFKDIKGKSSAEVDVLQQEFDRASKEIRRKIKQNAAQLPTENDSIISYAGVVVHEATHNMIETEDVTVSGHMMYGPNSCFWLAARHPDKALNNADNYRLYCECFL
ncbi:M35 family metallo-endopeptidase [Vibrio paucivorans]|uniref:M35 family metallopeptidase n=1 Tax=Vibrio paucivorans TaxID=2829489 RepID=A0A9X3HTF6_9VIBR|nr:M35 family metallo-endopeptidase [Vibrio paucivorans]MCW8335619.1 M35 family metallopeptidase [Vibrio paucivorans]